MTSANTGSEIIGAIYEAALGEQGWEPALELIRSSAGARQTCMIISDNRAAQPIVNIAASDDPRWSAHLAQLYNDEFYRNDPTCDAVGRLRVGNWYQDTEGLTSAQREASRFHQEFLRPNGLSTWSSLLIQQDSVMTLLSIQWED